MNVSLMDPTFELVSAADKIVVDDWHQSVHSDRVLARMHREGSGHAREHSVSSAKWYRGISGRENPDERIFWNPFGLAIEDIAVASAVYDQALSKGLGKTLQLVDQEWDVLFLTAEVEDSKSHCVSRCAARRGAVRDLAG